MEKEKKTCSKCGIEKEFDEFYRSSKSKNGRTSSCKKCNNKSLHNYHRNKKIKEATKILNDGCKICVKCNENKELLEFNKTRKSYDGYTEKCTECINIKKEEIKKKTKQKNKKLAKIRKEKGYKICKQCMINKNLNDFFKSKDTKDGYYSKCKECCKEFNLKNNEKNKKKVKEERKRIEKIGTKKCIRCKEERNISYFHKKHNHSSGFGPLCTVCKKKDSIEYRSRPEIIEKRKKDTKEYSSRPEVAKRRKIQSKKRKETPKSELPPP